MVEVLENFKLILEKKNYFTGFHNHSFTCEKEAKEKYLCQLLMARGSWEKETCPIMVVLDKKMSLEEKFKPKFSIFRLSNEMRDYIDTSIDYSSSFTIKSKTSGPIL